MHRSIRLALPAAAAATALAISGCSGEGPSPFEAPDLEESLEQLDDGATGGEDDAPEGGTGGDTGETEPPADEPPGDTSGGAGGDTGGLGGSADDIEGDWFTGTTRDDANLEVLNGDGTVKFYEDFGMEGDVCDGTIGNGTITLEECTVYGSQEWTDMTATYTVDGPTMEVTWSSGTTQTFRNAYGGGFDEDELSELQENVYNGPSSEPPLDL
ncbi:hypothetical protein [Streptomyces marincola]|uniref:hypothetical protein n=1 Tax=Streptomyces marincola TaxID=2878388 RepID=UPI001CF1544F|nr:hypothetical protein [Streptomyces marincola]UCM87737.1 hypothetical protein LC193_07115 [Streptomyces marincola]